MTSAMQNIFYCLRTILIKITFGPISFVFLEVSKFVLVLALAFWITVGIFMMWESIMPEAASRLSAAAAAVVANTSGLMPNNEDKDNANESSNYPFVVDLPKTESSSLETHIKDEALLQTAALEEKTPSILKNEPSTVTSVAETPKEEIKIDTSKVEVASAEAIVSKQPSAAIESEAGNADKPIE